MLVVAGTVTYDPAYQQAVIAAAGRVAALTRLEQGCLSYEFFADLMTPGRIHVFEEWEEEHHLEAHLQTPHLIEFGEVLQSSGLETKDINRYFVSSKRPNRPS